MPKITVDHTACIHCGACVEVCRFAHVFAMGEKGSEAVRSEECWACGQCVAACPTDAIDHETFPLEECPLVVDTEIPTPEQLDIALRSRRSVRTYEKQPVPREVVRAIVTSARSAPTASNRQAIDWLAFDDPARIAEFSRGTVQRISQLSRWAANPIIRPLIRLRAGAAGVRALRRYASTVERFEREMDAGLDPIFHHAPVVLIGHSAEGSTFGRDDTVYAAYNMMLAAERRGLGTCQIGFFQTMIERTPRLLRAISLPEHRTPQVVLTLGYPKFAYRRLIPRRIPDLAWNPR